jgi:hypothetical protein
VSDRIPPRALDNTRNIVLTDVAHFIAAYHAVVTVRPPTRAEQAAYQRGLALLAANDLPIPESLRGDI